MNTLKIITHIILSFVIVRCASTPPPQPQAVLPKSKVRYFKKHRTKPTHNDIDVDSLMHELKLDQSLESIGYQEKIFNTCGIAANRSSTPHCQDLYLGRINFQVMCRESTGTVEKVRLTPLHSRKLKWKGYKKRGVTRTNKKGFGQVSFISPFSDTKGYLYLYLGTRVARKRFHDRWKLILPKSWCVNQ